MSAGALGNRRTLFHGGALNPVRFILALLVGASVAVACGNGSSHGADNDCPAPAAFGISHAERWNLDSLYRWDESLSGIERVQRLAGDLVELGVTWYRPNLNWREVQPDLTPTLVDSTDLTEDLIVAAAAGAPGSGFDWAVFDLLFDTLLDRGITLLPVLGNSDNWRLPRLSGTEDGANPDAIGHDAYLLHLTLYARAAARRYSNRVGVWQLENELNVAIYTTVIPTGRKGNSWADSGFLDRLMGTLAAAVRAEDPEAILTTNFHTDLPTNMHDWREAVLGWQHHLDWIGLDVYPNYLEGEPVRSEEAAHRVTEARSLIGDSKPVLVLETGYPSAPSDAGFGEASQAAYLAAASRAAIGAGACGFFVYTLTTPERSDIFGEGYQEVEGYWGLRRSDGTAKPGYTALQDAYASCRSDAVGRAASR